MTVAWHIGDLKISHAETLLVDDIAKLKNKVGKEGPEYFSQKSAQLLWNRTGLQQSLQHDN